MIMFECESGTLVETTGLETSQYRVGNLEMALPQVSCSLSPAVVAPAEVSCPRLHEVLALAQLSGLLPAEVQREPWQYYHISPWTV